MIPFTLLLNLNHAKEGYREVFRRGLQMTIDWAQISAIFSGAEIFCGSVRGKDDRWNAYVGSGIGTASLGIKVCYSLGYIHLYEIGWAIRNAKGILRRSCISICLR